MNLHLRIAEALGWTEEEAKSFSLPTVRELVRTVNPKLAHEITLVMNSRQYWFEEITWGPTFDKKGVKNGIASFRKKDS